MIVCGEPIPEKRLRLCPGLPVALRMRERLEERNLSITETYDADLN